MNSKFVLLAALATAALASSSKSSITYQDVLAPCTDFTGSHWQPTYFSTKVSLHSTPYTGYATTFNVTLNPEKTTEIIGLDIYGCEFVSTGAWSIVWSPNMNSTYSETVIY